MKKEITTASRIWKSIMWMAIVGSLCCFVLAGWHIYRTAQTEQEYEALREDLEKEETAETAEVTPAPPKYTLEEIQNTEFTGEIIVDEPVQVIPEGVLSEAEENPVDFQRLQEINPELYAWIRIPNTKIDYPIAQRKDGSQTFYLHHDMYGQPRYAGCIYTENLNKTDFTDPVTVIYGHNMKNGSMFQNLHKFRKMDFFEENRYVYIYTAEETLLYEIFAAYEYDNRHILNSFDFSDPIVLKEYLDACKNPRSMEAHVRENVTVTADTPIITLSTCIGGRTEQRYLVQAVLVYKEAAN